MLLSRSRRTLKIILLVAIFTAFLSGFLNDALLSFTRPPVYVTTPVRTPSQTPSDANGPRERPLKHPPPSPLGEHRYGSDGLLEVNEGGAHPIYELISRAEEDWNRKLGKASKSLYEAVIEYRRRYHREPPRGFDDWWSYVSKHNVQLPDEYDSIYHDLEPFWGIEPQDLLKIREELESKVDSYTIGKNSSSNISVVHYAFQDGKYDQLIKGSEKILDLLHDVEDFLPPFRAVLSPHDGPNRLSDYGVKSALLQAALSKTLIERDYLPKINSMGWISACSPTSPARRKGVNLDMPPPRPVKKTFIYNHQLSMNPCLKPEHFHHHGQFLSHNSGPSPQHAMVPEFSSCSTTIHHNIRVPTPYGWIEDIYPRSDDPEWDDKIDERLLWRGSNTGIFHAQHIRWQRSHRNFLVEYTNELNGTMELLLPTKLRKEKVGKPKRIRNAHINPAMMDIGFAGRPISCSSPTCELLDKKFSWRARQTVREAGNYKYVLDVDGNGWSGRFKRLITSNSLIFKSTIYPEWYMDRIAPWVHYVPIQIDLSDLHDALAFFRGDGNGDGAHEDLARNIANAGRQWSKTFWRREDLVAYFFRLILEYSRLMSLDRNAMSYSEQDT